MRIFWTVLRHLAAALSMTALILCLIYPGYSVLVIPGDAYRVYQDYYRANHDVPPGILVAIGWVPKTVLVLCWVQLMAFQFYATFFLRPRLWVALLQTILSAAMFVWCFYLHLALIHLPMIKLFNDFAE